MDVRWSVLIMHIAAGSIALFAGGVALCASKGAAAHVMGGRTYATAMIVLLGTGGALAVARNDPFVAVNALFALYLVLTGWRALTNPPVWSRIELALAGLAFVCVTIDLIYGLRALGMPRMRFAGYPSSGYLAFALFATAAIVFDLRYALRPTSRGDRLARHLWRMIVPMTMAAGSLFLGQQQVFPHALRDSTLMFVPAIAPLPPMIWWLFDLRRRGARRPLCTREGE